MMMTRWFLIIMSAAAVFLSSPEADARTKLAALPGREAVAIRLDNPSATLVEEERTLTLQEGENLVDFSWRGVQIDPDSIRLAFLSHPGKVTLLSVSYPPNEEALVWRVNSTGAWEEKVRISYLLSYVDRLVTYRLVAARDEKSADLFPFLILRNFSGEDFTAARLTLGEGAPLTADAAHEETRQVALPPFSRLPIRKTFTWDAALLPWEPKRQEGDVGIPVHYVLENTEKSGLGRAELSSGKVRVYSDDGRGGTVFLGEDQAPSVPVGEKMRIYIGDSREVSVTQQKTKDLVTNPRPSRQKVVLYDTEETVKAEIQNFKESAVTIDLVEHIPGEWVMTASTLPFEKRDAGTIVFSVEVPAKGKAAVSFDYSRRNVRR